VPAIRRLTKNVPGPGKNISQDFPRRFRALCESRRRAFIAGVITSSAPSAERMRFPSCEALSGSKAVGETERRADHRIGDASCFRWFASMMVLPVAAPRWRDQPESCSAPAGPFTDSARVETIRLGAELTFGIPGQRVPTAAKAIPNAVQQGFARRPAEPLIRGNASNVRGNHAPGVEFLLRQKGTGYPTILLRIRCAA